MSAWWTSKKHVDLLVTAAIGLKVVQADDATETGKMLREENAVSLVTRYGDDMSGYQSDIDEYVFKPAPDENLGGVYIALHSYDYQACEGKEYDNSEAFKFVASLGAAIEAKLGQTHEQIFKAGEKYAHGPGGYWSVSEWETVTA